MPKWEHRLLQAALWGMNNRHLCHFAEQSTSCKCAWVKDRKLICILLCWYVQHVWIFTKWRKFAESIESCFMCRNWMFNHTDYFKKPIVNMCHYIIRLNDFFTVSRVKIQMLSTSKTKTRQKNMKMRKCKHLPTKIIRKHKNNWQSDCRLGNNLFPVTSGWQKRFRRLVDGYHLS